MQQSPNHSPSPTTKPTRGFALIVVLCLMVLISIVAVGLLSLASITLRASRSSELDQQARQNARLGLLLALGELQRTMGPDQRVSGPSSLVDQTGSRPHLTGVWEGWKWNGQGTTPNWSQRKNDQFKGWLVSTADPSQAWQRDFAVGPASGNLAKLVRAAAGDSSPVQANIVSLPVRGKNLTGGLAWAVFDQAEKASMTLPPSRGTGIDTRLDRMVAAPKPGYQATSSLDWTTLANRENNRQKLVTLDEGALVGLTDRDRSFHDLASHTEGLVVDVANGGFSKDLSRLFDTAALPSDYAPRYLYSDSATPLVPAPQRFNGANPLPSPDPAWSQLQAYYRSYTLGIGGSAPLETQALPRTDANAFKGQQICPVIAKAQFVFSISFGAHPQLYNGTPKSASDKYLVWLVVDPVITLWNPYNVPLRFTGGRVELYRVPLAFRLYKNGTLINPSYTPVANTFLNDATFGARKNSFYRLNLLPETGKSELLMAPGEHIVLTAHNHSQHFNQNYSKVGLELRPGFFPPAGAASGPEVGGVSTMNVCVDASGNSSGKDYGQPTRFLAVKPGDKIQVEVTPMHTNIDTPPETGGKEITGFLKYYVNSATLL